MNEANSASVAWQHAKHRVVHAITCLAVRLFHAGAKAGKTPGYLRLPVFLTYVKEVNLK